MKKEDEIIECKTEIIVSPTQQVEAIERANVDIQVETARKFPRDLKKCINDAIVIATMDYDTAKECIYSLPRGGKTITGESVQLARIIVSCYGNLRAESKVTTVTETTVTSTAMVWDLESNVAYKGEATRGIVDKHGNRYKDDMILVTGNAVSAIAYRNAVFAVIPKAITKKIYKAAQEVITGDVSDETKLLKRRQEVIDGFKNTYGIVEKDLLKIIGLNTVNQIKPEQLGTLIGVAQSLKDGVTTVDELLDGIKTRSEKAKDFLRKAESGDDDEQQQ